MSDRDAFTKFRFMIGPRSASDHRDGDWEEISPAATVIEMDAPAGELARPDAPAVQLARQASPPSHVPIPIPSGGTLDALLEYLELATGFHVGQAVYRFERNPPEPLDFRAEYASRYPERYLTLQVHSGACMAFHNRRVDHRLNLGRSDCYVNLTQGLEHLGRAEIGEPLGVHALFVAESTLDHLLGEPGVEALTAGLGLREGSAGLLPTLPPALLAPLFASLSPPPGGPFRTLHAQAKALEFLAGLAGHFAGSSRREPRKTRVVRDIKAELDGPGASPPSLADLARRHGLSQRVMTEAFRREYGQSILAYYRDRRLQAAHAAVVEGRLPLKAIAQEFGYSSVHHFAAAFARKFGYPPGSVRSRQ
jgi:AraC-like DNA-binding protein